MVSSGIMTQTTDPASKIARVRSPESALERVRSLARLLHGPDGCPWDRDQTVESLTPYLQEETFEVVEAVAARDRDGFGEELGDLLFLVLLLGTVAEDADWPSLDEAADGVVEKLIRRHPHVFGEERNLGTRGAVRQWEEIKREEKEPTREEGKAPSALGERPVGLPALTTAFRISEKAAAVGFQWPDIGYALKKLREETAEFERELQGEARPEPLEDEIGDLLYSVVNLARYLHIDPERALRRTTRKFTQRFQYVEQKLFERNRRPETATLEEMETLWEQAKEESP